MSIQGLAWAQETRCGDAALKVLLMTIGAYANTDNQTWHRQERIARDTEIPTRTLRRKLQQLVEMGLITVEERRDDEGRKMSSMITILMQPSATMAAGPSATSGGQPSATKVAGQESKSNSKKDSMSGYSEEFETKVWQPYPRRANTSKKKAYDKWRMLNAEKQALVIAAIPVFAAAMAREGRPEDKIKHLQYWLSEEIYETVGTATPAKQQAAADWYKTATRDQWVRLVAIWRGDSNWRLQWGPAPGKPGCMVPDDLLTDWEKGIRSQRRDPGAAA